METKFIEWLKSRTTILENVNPDDVIYYATVELVDEPPGKQIYMTSQKFNMSPEEVKQLIQKHSPETWYYMQLDSERETADPTYDSDRPEMIRRGNMDDIPDHRSGSST